ncbi:MAG: hypothetical protein HC795_15250 [Coleofasciculaceae cyanobacterium RL_1_1]|nr:hypothetical protein [Coleofasciculaceae cyanobacterium RL_1_1]
MFYEFDLVTLPTNGTLFVNGVAINGSNILSGGTATRILASDIDELSFTAAAGFTNAAIEYRAIDTYGAADRTPATILLKPTGGNFPPDTNDESGLIDENGELPLSGLADLGSTDPDDPDNDPTDNGTDRIYKLTELPLEGILYRPDPDNAGEFLPINEAFLNDPLNEFTLDELKDLKYIANDPTNFPGDEFSYVAIDPGADPTDPADDLEDATPGVITIGAPPTTTNGGIGLDPGTTKKLPFVNNIAGRDPDGSVASYQIDTLPNSRQGTLYLGDPATGGTPVFVGQSLSPADILNLFFSANGSFETPTEFKFRAIDDEGNPTSPRYLHPRTHQPSPRYP